MRYILVVHPDDSITLEPYETWESIQVCVEGPFQICGQLPPDEHSDGFPYTIYCNEEFLFQDGLEFNPVGSTLSAQPIYGNVAILVDGKTAEGDYDTLPIDETVAKDMKSSLEIAIHTESQQRVFAALRLVYGSKKPDPAPPVVMAMTEEQFSEWLGVEDF